LTFKDIRKSVTLQASQQQHKLFERLQNKPFWIWNIEDHRQEDVRTKGDCCFNHIIGLPQKDSVDKPLYDYEKTTFDTKEAVIELNDVKIEAFPSHHLDAMRGLPNVSFILLDEADFFPPGQQADARDVSERYIAKSNPYIVMVSTPNAPEGLFERIEKEPEDTCLYKRIFLDAVYFPTFKSIG
jgi:hypothetical protein